MFTLKLANIPVTVNNRFTLVEEVSRDYHTTESGEFFVEVTDSDIKNSRSMADEQFGDDYHESLSVYRKIAEKLPHYDAFLFHGSVIEYEGKAYIITANSGVGKTTHTRLWLSEFGDNVSIINGDKPIVRFIDGIPFACGTPWQGKENLGKNDMKPIGGIAFLERGVENRAGTISPDEAIIRFMKQIYLPKTDPTALKKTLALSNRILNSVRLVRLECNMNPEAAHVSKEALIN